MKKIGHCKWSCYYSANLIKIGCKIKTLKEWDDWFSSDATFDTKRDTEQFRKIYKSFLMAKAAIEIEAKTT